MTFVSCAATLAPPSGDPALDLHHADPRIRIDAAMQAVEENRLDLVVALIGNLDDRDGAVRLFSGLALRKLTGEDFDYKSHGTPTEREEAIGRWRAWLEDRRCTPSQSEGGPP